MIGLIIMIKKIPIHIIVASSSWISKIVVSLLQIFILKMLIEILGAEKYSIFAILTGLMGWFALFDFGIGFSLQNYISEYRAKNQDYKEILGLTFFLVLIFTLISIFVLYFLSPYFSSKLLKLFKSLDQDYKSKIFFITGACFLMTNMGSVLYKTLYAQDRGYLANFLPVFGYVFSVILIFFLKKNNVSNNLEYSVFFFLLPNAILPFFYFASFLDYKRIIRFNLSKILPILKRAFKFWIFALMAAFVLQIDYLVLSQYSNSKDIVLYNVLSKIFMMAFFVYSAILMAIWPVFSFNISKGNIELVILYFKRYLNVGLAYMIIFTIVLIFISDYIVSFFLKDVAIEIKSSLILLMGFYYILRVWTDMFAMLLQSANILKPFILYVPVQAFISFSMQIFFVKKYGLYGIIFGLIISFVSTVVWILPVYAKKIIFNRGRYAS